MYKVFDELLKLGYLNTYSYLLKHLKLIGWIQYWTVAFSIHKDHRNSYIIILRSWIKENKYHAVLYGNTKYYISTLFYPILIIKTNLVCNAISLT